MCMLAMGRVEGAGGVECAIPELAGKARQSQMMCICLWYFVVLWYFPGIAFDIYSDIYLEDMVRGCAQRDCQVHRLSKDDAVVRDRWRKMIRMVDEQEGCEWMDVSSGTGSPCRPGQRAIKRSCVCVFN